MTTDTDRVLNYIFYFRRVNYFFYQFNMIARIRNTKKCLEEMIKNCLVHYVYARDQNFCCKTFEHFI